MLWCAGKVGHFTAITQPSPRQTDRNVAYQKSIIPTVPPVLGCYWQTEHLFILANEARILNSVTCKVHPIFVFWLIILIKKHSAGTPKFKRVNQSLHGIVHEKYLVHKVFGTGLVHLRANVFGTGLHLWTRGGGFRWRPHFPGTRQ